jgi:hypothetical protein
MKKLLLIAILSLMAFSVPAQHTKYLEGTYKAFCDTNISITFNKDLTYAGVFNMCEGFAKVSGTYKIVDDAIIEMTLQDFGTFKAFDILKQDDMNILSMMADNPFACGNCPAGENWYEAN